MRRWTIAVLAFIEAGLAVAIFACGLELSHDVARNETVGRVARVAHAVVRRAPHIAFELRIGLHRRA
jgi:hypothetical protein